MKAKDIPDLLRSAIKDGKPLPTARTARLMQTAADSAYQNIFAALTDLRGVAREKNDTKQVR